MQLGTIVTCVKIKKLTLILLSCVRGTVLIYSPIICTWYSTHLCTVVYVCHSFSFLPKCKLVILLLKLLPSPFVIVSICNHMVKAHPVVANDDRYMIGLLL